MIAVLTLPEAQRMTGHGDAYDEIEVAGKSGVTPEQLRERIAAVAPQGVEVRTGQQQAEKQTKDIHDRLPRRSCGRSCWPSPGSRSSSARS